MKQTGIYTGPRFSTGNFVKALGNKITSTTTPTVGSIALWRGGGKGHMGVIGANGNVYSALSPSNGIGYQSVSDISNSINLTPTYYRIVG
jgi:surface antigen